MDEFIGYHNGEWMPVSRIQPDPDDRGVTLGAGTGPATGHPRP